MVYLFGVYFFFEVECVGVLGLFIVFIEFIRGLFFLFLDIFRVGRNLFFIRGSWYTRVFSVVAWLFIGFVGEYSGIF